MKKVLFISEYQEKEFEEYEQTLEQSFILNVSFHTKQEAELLLLWLGDKGYNVENLHSEGRLNIRFGGMRLCKSVYAEINKKVEKSSIRYSPMYINLENFDIHLKFFINFLNFNKIAENKYTFFTEVNYKHSINDFIEYSGLGYANVLKYLESHCFIKINGEHNLNDKLKLNRDSTFSLTDKFFITLMASCPEENNYETFIKKRRVEILSKLSSIATESNSNAAA